MSRLSSMIAASCAAVASAIACLAQPALAEPAKPGIERMYVIYCGDIALNDASDFTPGASGPGHLSVTCYLIKHARGWVLSTPASAIISSTCPTARRAVRVSGPSRRPWKANSPRSGSSHPTSPM